jgi:hypothetical protein
MPDNLSADESSKSELWRRNADAIVYLTTFLN